MGIRQKVAEEFGSTLNKEGKLGKQHAEDVIVTPLRAGNYHDELASSVFCGVMPGDGWSGRMEDSILQGCIPVVIQVLYYVMLYSGGLSQIIKRLNMKLCRCYWLLLTYGLLKLLHTCCAL